MGNDRNRRDLTDNHSTLCLRMRVDGTPLRVYLWTTYFYQLRFLDECKLRGEKQTWVPISICMWDPKWWKGPRCRMLVPSHYDPSTDCERCISENGPDYHSMHCNFLNAYRKQLDEIGFDRAMDEVINLALKELDRYGGNIALDSGELHVLFTGYEVPSKACSERFALAEWLRKNSGESNRMSEWSWSSESQLT